MRVLSNLLESVRLRINPDSIKPTSAGLLVTGNCCLKCQTCTYWKKRKKDLSTNQLKLIIDKCHDFGIKDICFTGGEPFLRKDLTELADYVKSKGMGVVSISNAFLFDPEIAEHFDSITVSVDGADAETHDKIRGVKGSWKKCIKALKHPKVEIVNFVVQRDNYNQIKRMHDLAEKYGKKITVFFYCDSGDLGQSSDKSHRKIDLGVLKEQLRVAKRVNPRNSVYYDHCVSKLLNGVKSEPCVSVYFKLMIDEKGNVYPCSHFNKSVGNLLKQDFDEIWDSYKDVRDRVRKGKYDYCRDCYSIELTCNFVHNPRTYLKSLSRTIFHGLRRVVLRKK